MKKKNAFAVGCCCVAACLLIGCANRGGYSSTPAVKMPPQTAGRKAAVRATAPATQAKVTPPVASDSPSTVVIGRPRVEAAAPSKHPVATATSEPKATPVAPPRAEQAVRSPVAAPVVAPPAAPAAAPAQQPQSAEGAVRRTHLQFATPEAAQEFATLAARRQSVAEAQRVLAQLLEEKQHELQVFDGQLRTTFGVDPDKKYQYDAERKTLYELVTAAATTNAVAQTNVSAVAAAGLDRQVRRQFEGEESAREFLQVLTAKQVTTQELDALRLMLREKQIEQAQTQQALNSRYSMVPERDYQFDRERRTLYELVPVPPTAATPTATP